MSDIKKLVDEAFSDTDFELSSIPKLDLYMDQILSLLDDGENKHDSGEKSITKTMINNYRKENLIMPIKGKKYSRKQIMQLLCIMNLKQNLSLIDIQPLIHCDDSDTDIDLEGAYEQALIWKKVMAHEFESVILRLFSEIDGEITQQTALAMALAVSSGATYLKRFCEQIADNCKDPSSS